MLKATITRTVPLYHAAIVLRVSPAPCFGASRHTFMTSATRSIVLTSKRTQEETFKGSPTCECHFMVPSCMLFETTWITSGFVSSFD